MAVWESRPTIKHCSRLHAPTGDSAPYGAVLRTTVAQPPQSGGANAYKNRVGVSTDRTAAERRWRVAVGERLDGANPRCAEKTFSAPWKGATMDVIYCDLNCCALPGRKILKIRVPQVRVLRTLTCGYPMSRPLRGDFAALRLIANMNILNSELLATLLANIA